jgi:hypothetical protein
MSCRGRVRTVPEALRSKAWRKREESENAGKKGSNSINRSLLIKSVGDPFFSSNDFSHLLEGIGFLREIDPFIPQKPLKNGKGEGIARCS